MLINVRFTQAEAKVRGAILGSTANGSAAQGWAAGGALSLIPTHTVQGMTVDFGTSTPDARYGAPPRDRVPV